MWLLIAAVTLGILVFAAAVIAPQRDYPCHLGTDPFTMQTDPMLDPFCADRPLSRPSATGTGIPVTQLPTLSAAPCPMLCSGKWTSDRRLARRRQQGQAGAGEDLMPPKWLSHRLQ